MCLVVARKIEASFFVHGYILELDGEL
jgi:hypothetical protein